ncbi:MAG: fibrobacter succinogenes major paralogous domain-containing protein, partial [Dysgonamonadaceae bacterium]|nr:fibrobacter succinogenes major paralogous domain-containing protein [Dysgonamonadaceae bacterium]
GTVNTYLDTTSGVETSKLNDEDGQIKSSETALYGKFIQRNVGTVNWRQYPETATNSATAPANDWTWGNPVNGITDLDPCQSDPELGGTWRVPTQAEWAQIASNNTWVWQDGGTNGTSGYLLKPGGTNKPTALFLPAAGFRTRNGGAQSYVGSVGYYWSSAVTSTNSYYLYFTNGGINAANTGYRAGGLTVRCVSE